MIMSEKLIETAMRGAKRERLRWRTSWRGWETGFGAWILVLAGSGAALACADARDTTRISFTDVNEAAGGTPPFLGFPRAAADWQDSPRFLSETPAFRDLSQLTIAPGILPYDVQNPLWSDGARKRRWVALPSGSAIEFSEDGPWTFPTGSVFIKHFGMALDERQPDDVWRLETRFLIASESGGYYGLVYKWNAEQSDAELLLTGDAEDLVIVQQDGASRQQTYTYPAASACPRCHSAEAGYVMGVHTSQLNGAYRYEDADADTGEVKAANQLATWAQLGLFDRVVGDKPLDEYPRLASPSDASETVERRVRSYWDSNCSMCHNPDAAIPSWDARFTTPLERQGVIGAEPYLGSRPDEALLVVPGHPERSLLYLRVASTQPGVVMPPLLRNRVDDANAELLRTWIEHLANE